jgi:site-specific DNA recombinase
LNQLKISPPDRVLWAPKTVIKIVNRKCYTGKAEYNVNGRVPNPNRPLGYLTLGIKKTLLSPKPKEERVTFEVPSLTTTELWKKANQNITERGRGRGKQGKTIQALFRTRMFCPRCGKRMSVLRGKRGDVFYYCRTHYCPWIIDPCRYNRFVPGTWDDQIWDELDVMLKDDAWIEQQLAVDLHQDEGLDKQIRLHQLKIRQAEDKMRKVEEGFDGGLYSLEEARKKKLNYQGIIEKETQEISRLQAQIATQGFC